MNCPYSNPTIQQCEKCPLDDCYRDEKQDDREKCKKHYYKDLESSRKYHRDYRKERYDTETNTVNCRKYRNPEKKKEYDHERYLRLKRERQAG